VPPPPLPPPPKSDAQLVSPTAVHRISGEPPKDLRFAVAAQLCIDPAGAVTSVQVGVDVDARVAAEVVAKLAGWRYEPFRLGGAAIDVCFQTTLRPKPPDGGKPPVGGSGSGTAGGGSGTAGGGSGNAGGGSGGTGGGSGGTGGGSGGAGGGSGGAGSGSGSGKPPPSGPPDQLSRADFAAVMAKLEPQVRQCRARLPAKGPVRISVRVGPRGRIQRVDVKESAGAGPLACVQRFVQGTVFPASKRGGTFEYEL
jgi:hypothetical protein